MVTRKYNKRFKSVLDFVERCAMAPETLSHVYFCNMLENSLKKFNSSFKTGHGLQKFFDGRSTKGKKFFFVFHM